MDSGPFELPDAQGKRDFASVEDPGWAEELWIFEVRAG